MENYVVLVIGGSGFLGQHMVGLLQTHADHVTEIRVLDVVPYVNRTDYESKKLVRQFVGSILDEALVTEACTGADSVIHLASLIDISLFVDEKRSQSINVEGTRTIIKACVKTNVKRLLYCSSCGVVYGQESIYNAEEDTTPYAKHPMFSVYGRTKQQAEKLVLAANSDSLKTVCLRPSSIYGDYDWKNMVPLYGSSFTKRTGYYISLPAGYKTMDFVYAGNVAWAFIQADTALETLSANQIAGTAYFVTDDTPRKELMGHMAPILEQCNLKPIYVPFWLFFLILKTIFTILKLLSFVYEINIPVGEWILCTNTVSALVTSAKARREIGYKPLFDEDQINQRIIKFIKSLQK